MNEADTTIPKIGETLRFVIKNLGLRPRTGAVQSLDLLASEAWGTDLWAIERKVISQQLQVPIKELCGGEWAESVETLTVGLLRGFRRMASEFDVGILPPEQGRKIMQSEYLFPMVADVLRALHADHGGPRLDEFIRFPFQAWCRWEKVTCLCEDGHCQVKVRDHFPEVEGDSTFSKWIKGLPIEKLSFTGDNSFRLKGKDPNDGNAWDATAWLMIARLLQAIPETARAEIAAHLNPGERKGPDGFTRVFHALDAAMDVYSITEMKFVEWDPIAKSLAATFQEWLLSRATGVHDSCKLHHECTVAEQVFAQSGGRLTTASGVIILRVRAWLAWDQAQSMKVEKEAKKAEKEAMARFEGVVDALWWCGGAATEEALEEAIYFAAGIGDTPACKQLWHRAKLLGLDDEGRKDLSDKDIRNLAANFKARFGRPPAKRQVKHPARELLPIDQPVSPLRELKRDELRGKGKPSNSYWEHGRLTPLMAHILWGSADNVRELLAHGHDVNICVEETGMTTLHCALWVLRRTGDASKLDLVLEQKPNTETVTKEYGEWAETPLWAAIGSCRPDVVERVLGLGAKVNKPCAAGHLPLYATLLHWHMRTPQGQAAMRHKSQSGDWPSNNPLLKTLGVAFDSSAQELNQRSETNPRHWTIRHEEGQMMFPPLSEAEKDGLRAIARLFLEREADPNMRSAVKFGDGYFTPALYALEIGDTALNRLIKAYGGVPEKAFTAN